jgi:hypothetical protein
VFRKKKQTGTTWNIVAQCSNAKDRWTTKVRLDLAGNRLTWTSARGSQTYVRCGRPIMLAQGQ